MGIDEHGERNLRRNYLLLPHEDQLLVNRKIQEEHVGFLLACRTSKTTWLWPCSL